MLNPNDPRKCSQFLESSGWPLVATRRRHHLKTQIGVASGPKTALAKVTLFLGVVGWGGVG